MAGAKKNQSLETLVVVTMQEVERVFDLDGGATARPRTDDRTESFDLFDQSLAEGGNRLGIGKKPSFPRGVYAPVAVEGWGGLQRTFNRSRAHDIDGKWVYVFVSKDGGKSLELFTELSFDKGKYRHTDLTADAKKDVREPKGDASAWLTLVVVGKDSPVAREYYFILAPYQLPWSALEEMKASPAATAARAMRFHDGFWTDVGTGRSNAKPFSESLKELKDPNGPPLSFVLYLVDPLKEGAYRASFYAAAVGAWQSEQQDAGKDPKYVLAKQLEQLASSSPELYDIVQVKLTAYLYDREKPLRRLHATALILLGALLRWTGQIESRTSQPAGPPGSAAFANNLTYDTFYSDGTTMVALAARDDKPSTWVSPFSALARNYRDPTGAHFRDVADIVAAVHGRLAAMPAGQAFLDKNFDRSKIGEDGEKEPAEKKGHEEEADAGAEMFFQFWRKSQMAGGKLVASWEEIAHLEHAREHVGKMLTSYAGPLSKLEADRLQKLIEKARIKLATRINLVESPGRRKDRKMRAAQAERRAAKGARGWQERLKMVAVHYKVLKLEEPGHIEGSPPLTSAVANIWMLSVECINLHASLRQFWEKRDFWSGAEVLEAAAASFTAMVKIVPEIEERSIPLLGGKVGALVGPAEVLGGFIEYVLAFHHVLGADTFGEALGAGMTGTGAMLSVAAFFMETGVIAIPGAAVVGVVALALMAIGSWLASESSDWKVFLRNSAWGERTNSDKVDGTKNGFGYDGELANLKNDVQAQQSAIDDLVWRFEPKVSVDPINGELTLTVNGKENGTGRWYVNLEVTGTTTEAIGIHWRDPDDAVNDLLGANVPVTLADLPAREGSYGDFAGSKITVSGTILFDITGDRKRIVTRDISFATTNE